MQFSQLHEKCARQRPGDFLKLSSTARTRENGARMLTTLAMLVLAGGEVSLDVAPGVVCVERARVVERLGREGVKVVEVTKGLAVDVRLSGATIDVRGRLRNEVLPRGRARACGVDRLVGEALAPAHSSTSLSPRGGEG
jgi:hypothetical protein